MKLYKYPNVCMRCQSLATITESNVRMTVISTALMTVLIKIFGLFLHLENVALKSFSSRLRINSLTV